jgi:putative transposase
MPRLARLDAPGVVHHVIIRGIERRRIFWDEKDHKDFVERLGDLLPKSGTTCYAWALLSNHAHFVFRSGQTGLTEVMRRLLTGYAVSFNRRHRRYGHLFQNRYKSVVCQEDVYLRELVRYIHLNPLRAGMVSSVHDLAQYPYSGHSVVMGLRKNGWQDWRHVLSMFGKRTGEGRKRYLAYVEAGVEQGRRPDLVGGGLIRGLGGWDEVKKRRTIGDERLKSDQRILGDSEFVAETLRAAEENFNRYYRLKSLGYDLSKVEEKVGRIFGLKASAIYARGREKARAEARGLLCYWAVRELGYKLSDLARRLGMTQPGVGYAVRRGERVALERGLTLEE